LTVSCNVPDGLVNKLRMLLPLSSSAGNSVSSSISAAGGYGSTGIIVLWYGTAGSVPTGWEVCDGSGTTPDLSGNSPSGLIYIMKTSG